MDNNTNKPKVADQLISFVTESGGTLFYDQFKNTYFSQDGTGLSVLSLKSTDFRRWLYSKFLKETGQSVNDNQIRQAIANLDATAFNSGEMHNLEVRIAERSGVYYYDLGFGAVRIDSEGWKVDTNPPLIFRSFPHQLKQVEPVLGGNVSDILAFVNLIDPDQQILFMTLLTTYFIPGFPHPVAAIHGSMGSGKTAMSRIIKDLVDPSGVSYLSPPQSEEQFVQTASHHWVVPLDNLSFVPQWLSDALSRAVTGTGFSKRALYTDDDDQVYNFRRAIVVNGINLTTQAPDLLDRSIIFSRERVPEKGRIIEKELWEYFDKMKPRILGAIFTAISKGIKKYPEIKLEKLPRMADFCQWGCALSEALGFTQDDFLGAYYRSIGEQHNQAIEGSIVGTAIVEFMKGKTTWEDTPTKFYSELTELTERSGVNTKSKEWPKNSSWLSKKIELIKHNLTELGIVISYPRSGEERSVLIEKSSKKKAINEQYYLDLADSEEPTRGEEVTP